MLLVGSRDGLRRHTRLGRPDAAEAVAALASQHARRRDYCSSAGYGPMTGIEEQKPVDLSRSRRVHVVGAGGAGMSAIAYVLHAMGHRVTGSDLKASPGARSVGGIGRRGGRRP